MISEKTADVIKLSTECLLFSVMLLRLYKSLARVIGFDDVHLYMRPVQFEFAVRKEIPKQLPVFITALQDDKQNVDR